MRKGDALLGGFTGRMRSDALPGGFTGRMRRMLGREYPAFMESYSQGACHALRVNVGKCDDRLLAERGGFHLTPVDWHENGFYFEEDDRPGRHPFHAAGAYYIQDASAQAPVEYLNPQPGERTLDLCAAPGGKSFQIWAAMKGRGILFCNEIHPSRAKALSENVERMGMAGAVVLNEAPGRLRTAFPEYFHRILVDAPCSGEGMFRKDPDASREWSIEAVRMCAGRQDEILDCAAGMLRPGGRLAYSTCTFAPEEDEGAVARFLQRHPEFSLIPLKLRPGMEAGRREWGEGAWSEHGGSGKGACDGQGVSGAGAYDEHMLGVAERMSAGTKEAAHDPMEGTARLWPHRIRGEGHFLALLEKKAAPVTAREPKRQRGIKEREYAEYLSFAEENLTREARERLTRGGELLLFGDQLYLLPEGCPKLDGIKALRPGLHLGTRKKSRFEPSHALALSLRPEDVVRSVSFSADSTQIADYLSGQTLRYEDVRQAMGSHVEPGWRLIAVEGMSIGWGKLAGGVMKNHYPKGLRRQGAWR